jgi:hypothetical protein
MYVVILYQLNSLLADSERARLIKKLSEANQQNRFLKRQVCTYFHGISLMTIPK